VDDRVLQKIVEASYLTAENAHRYRAILRYFYQQHEQLRYYLQPREVLDHLQQYPHFHDYSLEQLQQDLNQLCEWNNLIPRQDNSRVNTIAEFKRKRFRYQCSPYTIEIERMVISLENMGDSFGGSLERTHMDRLLLALEKLTGQDGRGDIPRGEEAYSLWEELYDNFRKLTNNAADYLAHLQSEKVEEIMGTQDFLAYKDAVTRYLRQFIMALQRSSARIEALLQGAAPELIQELCGVLAEYSLGIPRLGESRTRQELESQYREQWNSLAIWFVGDPERGSDLAYLQQVTTENIRRITRYVQRLGERHHNLRSRRQDYLRLAGLFHQEENLAGAHRLAARVFGLARVRHLWAEPRASQDIYSDIWQEPPTTCTVTPRLRQYQHRYRPEPIVSREAEKEKTRNTYLQEREVEREMLAQLLGQERVRLKNLGQVEPRFRKLILGWISRCTMARGRTTRTDNGQVISLRLISDELITLRARDGDLSLPDYELVFRKEAGHGEQGI